MIVFRLDDAANCRKDIFTGVCFAKISGAIAILGFYQRLQLKGIMCGNEDDRSEVPDRVESLAQIQPRHSFKLNV
jgi:hypothetical protein